MGRRTKRAVMATVSVSAVWLILFLSPLSFRAATLVSIPVFIDPPFDIGRVEPNELANFHVRDPAFGDEPTHEPHRHPEPGRCLGDIEQADGWLDVDVILRLRSPSLMAARSHVHRRRSDRAQRDKKSGSA